MVTSSRKPFFFLFLNFLSKRRLGWDYPFKRTYSEQSWLEYVKYSSVGCTGGGSNWVQPSEVIGPDRVGNDSWMGEIVRIWANLHVPSHSLLALNPYKYSALCWRRMCLNIHAWRFKRSKRRPGHLLPLALLLSPPQLRPQLDPFKLNYVHLQKKKRTPLFCN